MPRANRIFCRGLVWHITHRCHQRTFLLKFVKDRRRWQHWLFVATRRYGLCVLNYIATSNHVHLLIADQGNQEIAASMQLIAGRVAQEYNERKNRRGAFWEDRYHATAVQTGHHLIRCMSYIDLNMVRAGVVRHPGEWETSGYREIQAPRERKGIIDFRKLCSMTGIVRTDELQRTHRRWTAEAQEQDRRNPVWTETAAVGDEHFLAQLKRQLGATGLYRSIRMRDELRCLMEADVSYTSVLTMKQAD